VRDTVDQLTRQLAGLRPDLDISAIEITGRIGRIAIHLGHLGHAVRAPHGLDPGAADVLGALWRAGPPYELSPGRLAQEVTMSSGGMTGRLDRLEKSGVVVRRPDPRDRRGVLVRLTDKGTDIANAIVEGYLVRQAEYVAALTQAERERLARLLRKLLLAAEPVQGKLRVTD
jgi:DNA-binding MarR family transcriptional regulator